jgi:hypothetical protein
MEAVSLILKNGNQLSFHSHCKHEIIEIIGSFIGKNNRNRILLVEDLRKINKQRLTKYDPKNQDHEDMLYQLWEIVYPTTQLVSRFSSQWVNSFLLKRKGWNGISRTGSSNRFQRNGSFGT